jgi:adenosylhomocysteine nucleosidase
VGVVGLSHANATRNASLSVAGVVAALGAEARTLGPATKRGDGLLKLGDGMLVMVSGMGPSAAERAAKRLVQAGVTALVSWGMAGGLDPTLPAGTICVPHLVIAPDGASFATDHHWCELTTAAIAAGRGVVNGTLFCSSTAIEDVRGKATAFEKTGAVVVDMESAAVAKVAASYALPFLAVRVIVDTAADTLPDSVVAATGSAGLSLSRLVAGILKSPGELAPLLRLASRYRTAIRALTAVAASGALAPLAFAAASPSRIA